MPRGLFMPKTINYESPGVIPGDLTVEGDLVVEGTTTLEDALDVDGTGHFTGALTLDAGAIIAGNVSMSNSLAVTINATVGGTLGVTGAFSAAAPSLIGGQNPNLLGISGSVADLGTAGDTYFPVPKAGTIVGITAILQGALAVGNAVLTAQINGVAITTGVITFVQAGSAAGDTQQVIPTGANTVALGNKLKIIVSGTNTANVAAYVTFTLQYP